MVLAAALSVVWWWQGFEVLAGMALLLVPFVLAVGNKFELDVAARRYRAGLHWAHIMNPVWQGLPVVQRVVVKPHCYREVQRTKYNGMVDEGTRQVFTVLLSVPNARFGIVVASMKDEIHAAEVAAILADTLQVPWQQA
ncbi:hypothetical protein GCM10028822_29140 [Hymenobacter terrigena]